MSTETQWPSELRVTDQGRTLRVSFEGGDVFDLPAEYLRVESPSAEVQGHSPGERKIVGGKKNVAIIGVVSVGTYAVRLEFDDMHSTGLYAWSYLHELGRDHAAKWDAYLKTLAEKGLTR